MFLRQKSEEKKYKKYYKSNPLHDEIKLIKDEETYRLFSDKFNSRI